jgi:hypothetical protein
VRSPPVRSVGFMSRGVRRPQPCRWPSMWSGGAGTRWDSCRHRSRCSCNRDRGADRPDRGRRPQLASADRAGPSPHGPSVADNADLARVVRLTAGEGRTTSCLGTGVRRSRPRPPCDRRSGAGPLPAALTARTRSVSARSRSCREPLRVPAPSRPSGVGPAGTPRPRPWPGASVAARRSPCIGMAGSLGRVIDPASGSVTLATRRSPSIRTMAGVLGSVSVGVPRSLEVALPDVTGGPGVGGRERAGIAPEASPTWVSTPTVMVTALTSGPSAATRASPVPTSSPTRVARVGRRRPSPPSRAPGRGSRAASSMATTSPRRGSRR